MLLPVVLALVLGGGAGALATARSPRAASAMAVTGVLLGSIVGGVLAVRVLFFGAGEEHSLPWDVPYGHLRVAIDPLSAFFLMPLFVLSPLIAIYGKTSLPRRTRTEPEAPTKSFGATWLAFNVLVASMVVVIVARQAVLFLVAWEVMSLSAYVLMTFEHERRDVQRAGFTYLIAAHVGAAFLTAFFVLLGRGAQSFDFEAIVTAPRAAGAIGTLLFALAFVGFGVKSAFVPFHAWLPEAYTAAPSHASALMSSVFVNMGLYGLLRALLLMGHPATWWGPAIAVTGLMSAVFGIAMALYQRDMKRVLAYSSIENMGIIAVGLGTGLWGWASDRPSTAALGMVGALLHVWNHSLMKALLFLGAGSVLHGAGTHDLEHLGGLLRRMPRTSLPMLLGAVAISALPPLNGFVSEWLVYLGLIDAALPAEHSGVMTLFGVGVVSFAGGLAVLCFTRLVGIALLGTPRSEAAATARESPSAMTAPMAVLAAACITIAVAPRAPSDLARKVAAQILGTHALIVPASVSTIGAVNLVIWLGVAIGAAVSWLAFRKRPVTKSATWGCGYAQPTPRIQYTARSFAELMSERILPRSLRAKLSVVVPTTIFSRTASLASTYTDPLTRSVYEPFLARWGEWFTRLRWVQRGMLHVYLVYVVVAMLVALAWTTIRSWGAP